MAAMANLVQRGFARPDGSFPVPLVNIVMSEKVAEWAAAALAGTLDPADLERVPVDPFDVDQRCELIDGTPIHPFLAMTVLGNYGIDHLGQPNLRRHVLTAESRVLDTSVNARSFPEWQRTASLIETRGHCSTHGCEAEHDWLRMDHVHPVHHGGQTRFDNGDPLCAADNGHKGSTTGHTSWQHRQPPARRQPQQRSQPRPRRRPRGTPPSNGDPDGNHDWPF